MGADINRIVDRLKSKKLREIAGITQRQMSETPQKSYSWEISILGAGIIPALGSLLDNITVFAKSVTVPQSASEPIRMNFMGEPLFFSGKESSPHTVTITFWDDENGSMQHYLDQWYQLTHENETGNSSRKQDYQRTIKILMKDSTDTINTSITELEGCFPIEVSDIQLSYETSDIVEVSATFQYDRKKVIV